MPLQPTSPEWRPGESPDISSSPLMTPNLVSSSLVVEVPPSMPLWPDTLDRKPAGCVARRPRWIFERALFRMGQRFPDVEWVPVFRDEKSSLNAVARLPGLLAAIEARFLCDFGEPMPDAQRGVLFDADVILVGVYRASGEVVAYAAGARFDRGLVPGLPITMIHSGVLVVAKGLQAGGMGPILASVVLLYRCGLVDCFRRTAVVLRTGSRHMVSVLARIGPVVRSDQLSGSNLSRDELDGKAAISYTHYSLRRLNKIPLTWDRPLLNSHQFDEGVRLPGFGPYNCIYVAMMAPLWKIIIAGAYLPRRRSRRKDDSSKPG